MAVMVLTGGCGGSQWGFSVCAPPIHFNGTILGALCEVPGYCAPMAEAWPSVSFGAEPPACSGRRKASPPWLQPAHAPGSGPVLWSVMQPETGGIPLGKRSRKKCVCPPRLTEMAAGWGGTTEMHIHLSSLC